MGTFSSVRSLMVLLGAWPFIGAALSSMHGCATLSKRMLSPASANPRFSRMRMEALQPGLTTDQVKALFGPPDQQEITSFGSATDHPWHGLIYKYDMGRDENYDVLNVRKYNTLVFSLSGADARLNHYELPVIYPDERVPMYAGLPADFSTTQAAASQASTVVATQHVEWETLNEEVVSLRRQGRFERAVVVAKKALEVAERAFGPEHPRLATSMNNLALLYDDQGHYAAAEPLYKRSLAIKERALGPDHPDVAASLNNLAALYQDQGQYAAAESLYKRSLASFEKVFGPEHPDVATSLNNLAFLYKAQGQYAAAEPLYKRSLVIREKALGPDHPDVATSLNNLAVLYRTQGQYAAAEPLYKRALAIFEKALGPDHPDVATTLENMAALYLEMGRGEEARKLAKRAEAIRKMKR